MENKLYTCPCCDGDETIFLYDKEGEEVLEDCYLCYGQGMVDEETYNEFLMVENLLAIASQELLLAKLGGKA